MFPDNIVQMTFSQYESEVIPHYVNVSRRNLNDPMDMSSNDSSVFPLLNNETSKRKIFYSIRVK